MLTFRQRLGGVSPAILALQAIGVLSLTAEERTRSRHRFSWQEGEEIVFYLPRGTVLRDGDILQADSQELLIITAKPEPVFIASAKTTLALLQAAYHLGNRHVPLQLTPTDLRLSPDPVLRQLLERLGLDICEEIAAFEPEIGAYHHSHSV